ncbi:hypothetical protein [Maribacter sp. HTCC2170]|uniref:hypothetical protein n=1 Tax=Maribacter sp. (strain HTCC2170 / KCCM 42371) TaxID=313603 RepID=UPI00006B47ED|nr:hypothetical protein [Maribacter sp. HTCC2170]EAR01657.1 hypothetical protein FB2170_14053 [Maribacter sp. HTCC2170]
MNWKIEFFEDEAVLKMTVKGIFNTEATIKANEAQLVAGKKYNSSKFLVDSSLLVLDINRSVVFEIISNLYPSHDISSSSYFAMVKPKDSQSEALVTFYIMAMERMGWTAKMFPNSKKALDWLCEF